MPTFGHSNDAGSEGEEGNQMFGLESKRTVPACFLEYRHQLSYSIHTAAAVPSEPARVVTIQLRGGIAPGTSPWLRTVHASK